MTEKYSDCLVTRIRKNGALSSKGKRVGKDCPLTSDEIRAYVENDSIHAVQKIRENRGTGLAESLKLLNIARFGVEHLPTNDWLREHGMGWRSVEVH